MEFVEAVESLAQSLGIEVVYEAGSAPAKPMDGVETMLQTMAACTDFFEQQLKQSTTAIDYLKNRGISGPTAKTFSIGYAPTGWNNLTGDENVLVETGMLIKKEQGKTYDRFRNRLMFPIRDRRGRCIAFGGRVIDPKDNPKYLNSPESDLFHKSDEIYGLFEMKKAVTNIDRVFITEGYMDVVALAEHGVLTAVATLGTAINNRQIESLFRVCKHLIFCFDGDDAGKKAAWRSLEQCLVSLKEGRLAQFLFLPEGQDPDSFISENGRESFEQQVSQASTLTDYLFKTLLAECNIRSLEGRAQFLDRLRPYYAQIPLQSLKDQILTEIESQLGQTIDDRTLRLLGDAREKPQARVAVTEHRPSATRLAITLLLLKPSMANSTSTHHEFAETQIPGVHLLLQLIDKIHEEPEISTQNLLRRFSGDDNESHLYKLAAMETPFEDEQSLQHMFDDCLHQLQNKYIDHRKERLITKLKAGEGLTETEKQEHRNLFTNQS